MYDLSKEGVIRAVSMEQRVSGKTGKPYTMIIVRFTNDYEFEAFLNNEQKALIEYAVKDKAQQSGKTIIDEVE